MGKVIQFKSRAQIAREAVWHALKKAMALGSLRIPTDAELRADISVNGERENG